MTKDVLERAGVIPEKDDDEQNEKLEGYAPQSATTQRATSRTVVVRRAEADAGRI